jgi:hypothetical protein
MEVICYQCDMLFEEEEHHIDLLLYHGCIWYICPNCGVKIHLEETLMKTKRELNHGRD